MPDSSDAGLHADLNITPDATQPDADIDTRNLEDRGRDTDGEGQTDLPSDQRDNSELWEFTGGKPAERNVYKCTECTFESVLAVPRPADNWDGLATLEWTPNIGTQCPRRVSNE